VVGIVASGLRFVLPQNGSPAHASDSNTRLMASQPLTQKDENRTKLSALRSVVRQASADPARVRESLRRDPALLSPEQAYYAQAAVNAAKVAVNVAPTAVDMASTAAHAAQAAENLKPADLGSHTAAAGRLSAQAAADSARTTVAAAQAAVEAALAA